MYDGILGRDFLLVRAIINCISGILKVLRKISEQIDIHHVGDEASENEDIGFVYCLVHSVQGMSRRYRRRKCIMRGQIFNQA